MKLQATVRLDDERVNRLIKHAKAVQKQVKRYKWQKALKCGRKG